MIFCGRLLSTSELSKLAACFQTAHYKDGDVILREGEVSHDNTNPQEEVCISLPTRGWIVGIVSVMFSHVIYSRQSAAAPLVAVVPCTIGSTFPKR